MRRNTLEPSALTGGRAMRSAHPALGGPGASRCRRRTPWLCCRRRRSPCRRRMPRRPSPSAARRRTPRRRRMRHPSRSAWRSRCRRPGTVGGVTTGASVGAVPSTCTSTAAVADAPEQVADRARHERRPPRRCRRSTSAARGTRRDQRRPRVQANVTVTGIVLHVPSSSAAVRRRRGRGDRRGRAAATRLVHDDTSADAACPAPPCRPRASPSPDDVAGCAIPSRSSVAARLPGDRHAVAHPRVGER